MCKRGTLEVEGYHCLAKYIVDPGTWHNWARADAVSADCTSQLQINIERTSDMYVYREFSVTAPPSFRTKRLREVSAPCSASIIVMAIKFEVQKAWNRKLRCSAEMGRD